MVERRLGNLQRAEELALQALRISAGRGDEMSIAWTLNSLAAVTAAAGDHERAATLLGTAAAMLGRAGGEWPPDEREQHDESLATVAAALPRGVLDEALARGAGLSVTDGVAYALRG
nr:tetratricopeptide repeat protein [Cellulomonas humilata]